VGAGRAAAPELLLLRLPCFPLAELPAPPGSPLVAAFHGSLLPRSPGEEGAAAPGARCQGRGQLCPPALPPSPPLRLAPGCRVWGRAGISSDAHLGSWSDSRPLTPFAGVGKARAEPGLAPVLLPRRIPAPSSLGWEAGGFPGSLAPCVGSTLPGSFGPVRLRSARRSRVCLSAPGPPPQRSGAGLPNSLFVPEPQVGVPDERGCAFLFPALRRRWSTW